MSRNDPDLSDLEAIIVAATIGWPGSDEAHRLLSLLLVRAGVESLDAPGTGWVSGARVAQVPYELLEESFGWTRSSVDEMLDSLCTMGWIKHFTVPGFVDLAPAEGKVRR